MRSLLLELSYPTTYRKSVVGSCPWKPISLHSFVIRPPLRRMSGFKLSHKVSSLFCFFLSHNNINASKIQPTSWSSFLASYAVSRCRKNSPYTRLTKFKSWRQFLMFVSNSKVESSNAILKYSTSVLRAEVSYNLLSSLKLLRTYETSPNLHQTL